VSEFDTIALTMRIGMIGLGFMGLTHLKGIKNIPGVEVGAVCSDVPQALTGDLSSVQGNLGGSGAVFDFSKAQKFSDAMEAVRKADVEAVDLCLPTRLHAPVAIEALKAGKHVLVEKPMALEASECAAMIDAAHKSGTILMSAQVLRFFNAYLPLIDAVRTGKFGQVRHALFRRRCAAPGWGGWLRDRTQSGGGVFDLLIHDIDMMQYLFGMPKQVRSWGHEDLAGGLDLLTSEFDYAGFSVTVTGGWHHMKDYPFSMEYTVAGDGGAMEYSSAGRDPRWYSSGGGDTLLPMSPMDGYQAEVQYFIECCRANQQPKICAPESSAASVALTRLAEQARAKKGEAVPCTL